MGLDVVGMAVMKKYIAELAIALGKRFKEHLKVPSLIYELQSS